jgi:hypothetical protein
MFSFFGGSILPKTTFFGVNLSLRHSGRCLVMISSGLAWECLVVLATNMFISTKGVWSFDSCFYKNRQFVVCSVRNCILEYFSRPGGLFQHSDMNDFFLMAPSLLIPDKNGGAL